MIEETAPSFLLSQDRRKKYTVISEGYLKTSIDLRNRSFDSNYSGTTVVSVMLTGTSLICTNVGDSRAVLASIKSKNEVAHLISTGGKNEIESIAGPSKEKEMIWVATALSRDHKPDTEDEL
jgi:serine/threonine protein phosphatase PrpC